MRGSGSPQLVLLGAALAPALVGTAEALLLLGRSSRPWLDLEVLPFAFFAYGLAGLATGAAAWPLLRFLGRLTGSALFPWRLPQTSAQGLHRAWFFTLLLSWAALAGGTDAVHLELATKLGTPTGLGALAGAFGLAFLLGWFLVPAAARRTGGPAPGRLGGPLLLTLAAGVVLGPPLLEGPILHLDRSPARPPAAEGPPALPEAEAPGPPRAGLPDVVLVTLDTTRADHLSAYGYGRDTSPQLEAFAREAVRFDCAWAASSWTVPAHATLFTGLFPYSHGARYKTAEEQASEPDPTRPDQPTWVRPLDPAHVTLAEVLRAYGYATGAFVAGPYLMAGFGLAQGFDWYDDRMVSSAGPQLAIYHWLDRLTALEPDLFRFGHGYRRADEVNAAVLPWLEARGGERFLLFVNYFDAHEPYWPVAAVRDRYPGHERPLRPGQLGGIFREVLRGERAVRPEERAWITSQYDAELRFQDQELGRLFEHLRALGRWDEALVIVLVDHGEHLGEADRLGHGFTLYAPVTRIPLLVKFPRSLGIPAQVRTDPVHQADVMPTVLSLISGDAAALPGPLQGRDLRSEGPRTILSELYRDHYRVDRFGPRFSRQLRAWTGAEGRLIESTPLDERGLPAGEPALELLSGGCGADETPGEDSGLAVRLADGLRHWLAGAPAFEPSSWLRPAAVSGAGASLSEVGYVRDGGAE